MAGNVWELVEPLFDRVQPISQPPPDDPGHSADDRLPVVVRSGSYYHHGDDSATANGEPMSRGQRDSKVGLRLCADVAR